MINFDAIEDDYLFGKTFEEQPAKITSAKQKSKSIFTGLQGKPKMKNQFASPANRPVQSGSLLNSQQRGRGQGSFLARRRGEQLFSKSVSSA